MKKLMTVMAVIAIAAVVTSSPAEARRGAWWGDISGGGYYDLAAAPGLNLTAEQSAKLTSLREAHLWEVKPLQDQVEVKGVHATMAGKPIVLASEVKKGDKTLVLRDAAGVPVWSGWRR